MPTSGLYQILLEDLRAQGAEKSGVLTMLAYLRRPGFLAVFLYRLSATCIHGNIFSRVMAMFFARLNYWFNACEIYPEAVIGPGFLMGHPLGVVIGMATIGRNFRIQQNATLGVRNLMTDEHSSGSYPVIGDDVFVCVGAAVLGNVKIGNGAIIGANAVVLDDVPPHYMAIGTKAHNVEIRKTKPHE